MKLRMRFVLLFLRIAFEKIYFSVMFLCSQSIRNNFTVTGLISILLIFISQF